METDLDALLARDRHLRRLARRLVLPNEDPADFVQEAWLASLAHPPRPGPGLGGWFSTVLRNVVRRSRRSRLRAAAREAAAARPERGTDPDEVRARDAARREVAEAVLALEPIHRDVVLLRYFEGFSTRETARRLGVAAGTVKSRLNRALAELRKRLDDRPDGDRRRFWLALLTLAAPRWPAAVAAVAGLLLAAGAVAVSVVRGGSPAAPPTLPGPAESTAAAVPPSPPPPPAAPAVAGKGAPVLEGNDVDVAGRWRVADGADLWAGSTLSFDPALGRCQVAGFEVPFRRCADGAVELRDDASGIRISFMPRLEGDVLILRLASCEGWPEGELPEPPVAAPSPGTGEPAAAPPAGSSRRSSPPSRIEMTRLPPPADMGEEAAECYAAFRREYLTTPDGGRVAFPATPELGKQLFARLPEHLRLPANLLESHLPVLDRAPDFQDRELARLALASSPEAVELLLRHQAFRELSLQGRREVANVLAMAGGADPDRLVRALDDPADPVVLMALFLVTRHTAGSPPRYLLEDGTVVPDDVAAHWRRFVEKDWPARRELSPAAAQEVELAEIRALFGTEDALDFEAARARVAALVSHGYADYRRVLGMDRDRVGRLLSGGPMVPDGGLFWRCFGTD